MEEIINLRKIKKLLDSSISAYEVAKETGLTRAVVNRYRTGDTVLENMTIKVALKLQAFYDTYYIEPSISYDSEELIEELEEDIAEFGPDFPCWVTFKKVDGVKLYTDYTLKTEEPLTKREIELVKERGEDFEIIKASHLLELFKKQNEIL